MKIFENIKKIKNIKLINIAAIFCASVLLISTLLTVISIIGERKIYQNIIRLHVLPNSNSEEDQHLKLEVRDYILDELAVLTEDCKNSSEAADKINAGLGKIQELIKDFISQKGYDYPINATLTREVYPTRTYIDSTGETFALPSGQYQSLQVLIGESGGDNWWCVLFPPLCLSGSKIENELAVAGYSQQQINVLKRDSNKTVVRFKIHEIISGLWKK